MRITLLRFKITFINHSALLTGLILRCSGAWLSSFGQIRGLGKSTKGLITG